MGQENNKQSGYRKGGNSKYYQDGKRQDNYRGYKKRNSYNPASGQNAQDRGGEKGEGDRPPKQKPNYNNQRNHQQRDHADNRPKMHRNAQRPEVETADDISRDIKNIEAEIRAEIDELKAYRASFS